MMHDEDLVVNFFDFGGQVLRCDLQLRDDIYQGIDTAFQLEEFIQYNYLFLLQDTIPALEVASFIANDVFSLIQHPLYLIQCGLRILHHFNRKGNKYWSLLPINPFDFIHRQPLDVDIRYSYWSYG